MRQHFTSITILLDTNRHQNYKCIVRIEECDSISVSITPLNHCGTLGTNVNNSNITKQKTFVWLQGRLVDAQSRAFTRHGACPRCDSKLYSPYMPIRDLRGLKLQTWRNLRARHGFRQAEVAGVSRDICSIEPRRWRSSRNRFKSKSEQGGGRVSTHLILITSSSGIIVGKADSLGHDRL